MPKTIFRLYIQQQRYDTWYIAPELEDARHEVEFGMRSATNTPAQYMAGLWYDICASKPPRRLFVEQRTCHPCNNMHSHVLYKIINRNRCAILHYLKSINYNSVHVCVFVRTSISSPTTFGNSRAALLIISPQCVNKTTTNFCEFISIIFALFN